jgi:hypothetical protein
MIESATRGNCCARPQLILLVGPGGVALLHVTQARKEGAEQIPLCCIFPAIESQRPVRRLRALISIQLHPDSYAGGSKGFPNIYDGSSHFFRFIIDFACVSCATFYTSRVPEARPEFPAESCSARLRAASRDSLEGYLVRGLSLHPCFVLRDSAALFLPLQLNKQPRQSFCSFPPWLFSQPLLMSTRLSSLSFDCKRIQARSLPQTSHVETRRRNRV